MSRFEKVTFAIQIGRQHTKLCIWQKLLSGDVEDDALQLGAGAAVGLAVRHHGATLGAAGGEVGRRGDD